MRVLVQRVLGARVQVDGVTIASIGPGLLLFVGIRSSDNEAVLRWHAKKCAMLRIFADDSGKMNRSVRDIRGEVLVVSQFTLYGDTQKGHRPSFVGAAEPGFAAPLYGRFCAALSEVLERPVASGRFGADMSVELTNDGPVTLWLEREAVGDEVARPSQAGGSAGGCS